MRVMLVFSFSLWVLAGTMGCATGFKDLKEPKVKIQRVKVAEASLQGANLIFNLKVDNPNSRELAVNGVRYKIKVNGRDFADEFVDQKMEVAAHNNTIISLPLRLKYSEVFDSVSDLFRHRFLDYQVSGSVIVGLLPIPFESSGKIELDEPSK